MPTYDFVLKTWATDTIKLAFLTDAYTFDRTHQFWDDVSANEVSGTGYTAGGFEIANVSRVLSGSVLKVDGDDVSEDPVTMTDARWAVIYKDTGTPATSEIYSLRDLGNVYSPDAAPVVFQFSGRGIGEVIYD